MSCYPHQVQTKDESFPAKKLLAVSVGLILLLFIIIVVLIMRHQRLRRDTSTSQALPTLSQEDEKSLSYLRAFGAILEDYGWQIYWNEPSRYEKHGTVHLVRGSLHHEFPDNDGATVRLGVDALTFSQDSSLPDLEDFPLEKWRDLHPLRSFTDADSFPWEVKRAGRTIFVFYKYQGELPTDLPDQLETFIVGDSRQRASFRRELSVKHQREQDARKALDTIQQSLSKVALYEGEPDGRPGWRTKHAIQRFLRQQDFYSGDIDGVFGNQTLQALYEFREKSGLEKSEEFDLPLAEAIVKTLESPPVEVSTESSSTSE